MRKILLAGLVVTSVIVGGAVENGAHGDTRIHLLGNQLYNWCSKKLGHRDSNYCLGYIAGVSDAVSSVVKVEKLMPFFCIPEKVKLGQKIDIVKKYLTKHPEERHLSASALVIIALREAFPCPQE